MVYVGVEASVDVLLVSEVLAVATLKAWVLRYLPDAALRHFFHDSLAFSLRRPWKISRRRPWDPTNKAKMIWNVVVIPCTAVLVARNPRPQPSPNITARAIAVMSFCLIRWNITLVSSSSWCLSVLENGHYDDKEHDPVEDDDHSNRENEAKEKWPLGRPATEEKKQQDQHSACFFSSFMWSVSMYYSEPH